MATSIPSPMALGSFASRAARHARTLPERHGGPAILVALALVVALGFGLRLDAALNPSLDPGEGTIVAYQGNDSKSYGEIAQELYRTGRYGTEEMRNPADWSPLAPFFHAGVYFVTGGVNPDVGLAAVALLGGIMVLLVYLLGRRLGGPAVGLLAALLAAIYPAFIDNNEQILSEPIAAFTLSAAALGFLWAGDPGRSLWAWLVPGAMLGATALARPEYLMFALFLGLIALVRTARRRDVRAGVLAAALFVAAFGLVLAPWTLRNYVVLDRFVPVTTGGGKALFVATYMPGDGRQLRVKRELIRRFEGKREVTDREVADTQMKDLLDKVARKYPDLGRDAALAKIGRENFRKYVREDPVGYAGMVVTKMWNVWRRGSGPTMRAGGWIAFHYAVLGLAILGLAVLAWRRRWEALVLGTLIAGITVLGGLLLAVPRRNVPLMPLVLTLAAAGAVWLAVTAGGWLAERRRTRNRRATGRPRQLRSTWRFVEVGSKTWRAPAVLVAALACAVVVAQPGSAQTVTERLPDLVADAPARPIIQTYSHPDGTTHLLLRFDGFVHNQGVGAFEIRGSQPVGTDMTLTAQRVYRSDGSFFDDTSRDPPIIWEPDDDHNHWHLKNAALYSLWNSDKTAEVAPALKVGFCLIDSERRETHGPSSRVYTSGGNNFCGQDEPARPSIVEGVSAGWRDLYDRTLAFQWVDITDVQPGVYWLRAEIDPDDIVRESNEVNAGTFATASSTIPGYRARPVSAGVVSASGPTTINLATDTFGTPGARVFRIVEPPHHGRLSQASGPTFSSASVVYTPDPGWVGPDTFTYEARDSANTFPRYPAAAAVTLNVGGVSPSVALSGAPASMTAGTSVRLFASVIADNPRVRWTIDGISGGSAQVGSVDPTGLYLAPAQAPPSGSVTIRATTISGAFDEVTIAVTDPPPPQPAPATAAELAAIEAAPAPSVTEPDRGLQRVGAMVDGRFLLVSARSRQAGVVRIRARNGDRPLGRCRLRTPAGRPLTCRIRIPRSVAALKTRVTITLRVGGRLVEVVETDAQRRRHHR